MIRTVRLLGVIAALAVAAALAARWQRVEPPRVPWVEYTVLDGSKHTTAQWQGRVMVVNFWATSCSICVEEMPRWIQTYHRFEGRGLGYLAVAMPYDAPARVVDFASSRQLPFPVAIDLQGTVARAFDDTQATPTTFVLNRQGDIVRRYVGRPDFNQVHALIEQLLAGS